MTLLDFQLVLDRHNIRPPHFASKVSYSASPQASAKCPRGAPCSDAAFAMLFGSKTAQRLFLILNTLTVGEEMHYLYSNTSRWRRNTAKALSARACISSSPG